MSHWTAEPGVLAPTVGGTMAMVGEPAFVTVEVEAGPVQVALCAEWDVQQLVALARRVFFLERYAEVWKATRLTHPSLPSSFSISHDGHMQAELRDTALKQLSCGPDLG
jgi:hypothetical protein